VPLFLPGGQSSSQGNLKKLKLNRLAFTGEAGAEEGADSISRVVDVRGNPAFELHGNDKGQLRYDALTFWTDVATLPPGDGEMIPRNVDGSVVARGGAGQKIDGFVKYDVEQDQAVPHFVGDTNGDAPVDGYLPRQLFYEPPIGLEFKPFEANATTLADIKPLLDPASELTDEILLDLIRWARGQDTDNGKSTARRWLLGEVMHSRPAVLNYGATPGYSVANPNVRLLFGSTDGIFHIVENTDVQGGESGREIFGFYPRESVTRIRSRHDAGSASSPRYYGVDGAPVIFKVDRDGNGTLDYRAGDEAYVYFGLRRGGSRYFALEISNPDADPRLLWQIGPVAGSAFEEMGLTFSTPLVGKVNYNGVPVDVLVFAGGYNGGWNEGLTARRGKDFSAEDDASGNAIYIVNARTGALVWKAVVGVTGQRSNTQYSHSGLVDSIPSPVSALLTPAGVIHRLYVGDSGGAVWRVDLPPAGGGDQNHRRDNWFITQLADLGFDAGQSAGAETEDRRFFHAPDIVRTFDDVGDFDGVLIQSGNRADPNETLVENALFYIKDRQVETGSAAVRAQNDADPPAAGLHYAQLQDQSSCVIGTEQVTQGGDSIACSERTLEAGWKVRFSLPGEKGLSTPLTDGGRVFASTFVPAQGRSCYGYKGQGQLHVLLLSNATAVANQQRAYELGSGIPAPAVSAGDAIFLPGGGVDLYDMDGDGQRDTVKLLPSMAEKIVRTYWREPGVDPL
jgi:type IV pilus assembly protein PilY1